jgi:DNA repair exonuclease SbcCD nuclease subunit
MAWFCFTSIDQDPAADPDEVLRRYTYERVDSFFETGESRYSPFYGKRVFSPAELRQQDRTIWFVRDSRPDDPSQEIQLLQPTSVAPYHFPNRAIEDDGDTFLWLSDLHLSEDHHNFPLKATTSRFDLAGALERDLKNMGVKRIAAVLISGDLTWSSAATEFHFVSEFLRGIKSWSKLDNYQFVLCPGNHDMTFSASPGELDSEVTAAAATARAGYARLYEDLYGLRPNDYLSLGRRFLLARGIPVEIASINSSLLDQIEGAFQGHGFVGEQQLADLARQLRWDEGGGTPRALRIAMLHHHVVPITYREIPQQGRIYSVALDAGALTRWAARHRVDMILHGHMHQPAAARLQVPLSTTGNLQDWHEVQIIGMGSTGVARGELGEIGRNTFGLIRFKSEGVALSIYTIDPVRPREVTDPPYFEIQVSYPRWP